MVRIQILGAICFFPSLFYAMPGNDIQDKASVRLNTRAVYSVETWFKSHLPLYAATHEKMRNDFAKQTEHWICPKCSFKNPGAYTGRPCNRCTWPYDGGD